MKTDTIEYRSFSDLSAKEKFIVSMYTTARQFNHAISDDEVSNCKIIWNAMNKNILKIYPYIVNKAFACELFLKLIIKYENFEDDIRCHHLKKLFEKSKIEKAFKQYISDTVKTTSDYTYTLTRMYKDLESISNAFVEWRYIYELNEAYSKVDLLRVLSTFLEKYCKDLIATNYNIDTDKSYI